MRSCGYRIRTDRIGDFLELLLAAILEANVPLAFDFAVHRLGNQDAARIGDPLQPDGIVAPLRVCQTSGTIVDRCVERRFDVRRGAFVRNRGAKTIAAARHVGDVILAGEAGCRVSVIARKSQTSVR
jgi:hypothetical protein